MSFEKWFVTFLEEKEVDMSEFVKCGDGTEMQLGNVCSCILSAPDHEQEKIKDVLVMIDFKNGDVTHFLKHLAKALTSKDRL